MCALFAGFSWESAPGMGHSGAMTSAAAVAAAAEHTEAVLAAAHRAYKASHHLEALQLCQMVRPACPLRIQPSTQPPYSYTLLPSYIETNCN